MTLRRTLVCLLPVMVAVLAVAAWQAWLFVTGLADLLWLLTLAAVSA